MKAARLGCRIVLLAALCVVAGCGPRPAQVKVAPIALNLEAEGQTAFVSATVYDARGDMIKDARLKWTSSDPTVAAVDQRGAVTAVSSGDATITARSGRLHASCSVLVVIPDSLTVTPSALTLEAGTSAPLAAVARNEKGDPIDAPIRWKSSNPPAARVSADGAVTAVSPGTAVIQVEIAGLEARVPVEVLPAPEPSPETEEPEETPDQPPDQKALQP